MPNPVIFQMASTVSKNSWAYLLSALCIPPLAYVVYQRYFHPLAKYPGPFWASITPFWKLWQFLNYRLPQSILELHQKYGAVVRIGPNDIDFWDASAIKPIYRSGRSMPKSDFYDGFKTFNANLFGTRDEGAHSHRRKLMSHTFSMTWVTKMESVLDRHVVELRKALDSFAETGQEFDISQIINYFAYDIIGELAFGMHFNTQKEGDPQNLPPINDHTFLGSIFGLLSFLLPYSRLVSLYIPSPWLQGLIKSRMKLRAQTNACVAGRIQNPDKTEDLMSPLINATDPMTGRLLSLDDLATEAFGFLIAGSHTTSSTSTLLFFNLLHSPGPCERLVDELDRELPSLSEIVAGSYSITGLENKLPYLSACIKESFRLTPIFGMPLPRRVEVPGGMEIAGEHIPRGVNASMSIPSVHHNAGIWGPDHSAYVPDRWLKSDPAMKDLSAFLIPFSTGHRSCIGRNIAQTSILKLTAAVFRNYVIELVDPEEKLVMISLGISEKRGPLLCKVKERT